VEDIKIILIGNYLPDKQESMIRFAQMLDLGFRRAGVSSEIWWPIAFFGVKAKSTSSGLGKWLGYLDKYIIFPFVLRWRLLNKTLNGSNVRFHVCDHSNAPYLKYLPADRTSITCHDVIAIRGGMGYTQFATPASSLGKLLQKWIFYYLSRSKLLASVSQFTLNQLRELLVDQASNQKEWQVIYNAFNADFRPMKANKRRTLLNKAGLRPDRPFLLHVGSEMPRKNRKLLLEMVFALGNNWDGFICYAGSAIDEALIVLAKRLGLQDRVVSIANPDHNTLVALYSACEAFIFPSLAEGFGWPVIEAQACGAPVIASNIEPIPEVSGGAALLANSTKPQEFADALLLLKEDSVRSKLIQQGYLNCRRFELAPIIDSYLFLHGVKPCKS
jgi:glycosyltransferase involved in cell wall biosynthesis